MQIRKLIDQYFPEDQLKAEQFLKVFSSEVTRELEKYAESQYRKYKSSTHPSIKNDPWILGTSEGADRCIEIIKKIVDE